MEVVLSPIMTAKNELDLIIEFTKNLLHLEEAASLHKKATIIKEKVFECDYSPESIIDVVCGLSGYSKDDILGKSRMREYVDTRACLAMLIQDYNPNLTPTRIGRVLKRDRNSVIHELNLVEDVPDVKKKYVKYKKFLESL